MKCLKAPAGSVRITITLTGKHFVLQNDAPAVL